MTHKQICNDEDLTLYHYQELTAAESQSLEQHLAECSTCRAALDELRRSLAAVPSPKLRISAAQKQQFTEQITARIGQRKRTSLPNWGTAFAVASVLGLMVLILQPGSQSVVQPPPAAALADLEVLEQFDLLKDLELLRDLELLEEFG